MNINDHKFHQYYDLRNQTLNWWGSDNKDAYERNLKTRRNELEQNGWIDKEITYTLNSEGFRCPEFDGSDCILFLGKSITAGVSLEYDKIYPTLVSKTVGLRCANVSIPGTSNDTSFRLALHWIEKLKPKIVVFDSDAIDRIELLTVDYAMNFVPSLPETHPFYFEHMSTEENSYLNYRKNLLAISKLCDIHKIKFVESNYIRLAKHPEDNLHGLEWVKPNYNKFGRDLVHPGNYAHLNRSLAILDDIAKLR
jgi:hypothetical protein